MGKGELKHWALLRMLRVRLDEVYFGCLGVRGKILCVKGIDDA